MLPLLVDTTFMLDCEGDGLNALDAVLIGEDGVVVVAVIVDGGGDAV